MNGPVFEVRRKNRQSRYYVRELGGGRIKNHSQTYSNKSNAVRAARRKAAQTIGATVRILSDAPLKNLH